MLNKIFTSKKLIFPAMLAFMALVGCNPEQDMDPATELSAEASLMAQGVHPKSNVKLQKNHYVVLSSSETMSADIAAQLNAANGEVTSLMEQAGVATVYSDDPNFVANASKIMGVRSVVRDLQVQWYNPDDRKIVELGDVGTPPASGDNDRFFDLQWGHAAIKAPQAWNSGQRGKGARVAVLDSGFDLDHPDLAPNINIDASKNFVPGEVLGYALPDVGSHGTHTAGTIAAADNGIGIIGVAPEAELILVKVLRDSGSGSFSWMINGIIHATQQGANVINMSLGAALPRNGKFLNDNGTPEDTSDDFIESDTKAVQELLIAINRATSYATKNGVTVIASAGNDANNGNADKSLVHIPSSSTGVISISATAPRGWALNPFNTFMDDFASYSNYGTSDVHFAAPGGDYMFAYEANGFKLVKVGPTTQPAYIFDYVFSTGSSLTPGIAQYYWSVGTSMAGPHAAGVAALIIGKNGGKMEPAHVLAKLRDTSDDLGKSGRDPYYGYGRVNALRAVTE